MGAVHITSMQVGTSQRMRDRAIFARVQAAGLGG
jgi:hypothetical protein